MLWEGFESSSENECPVGNLSSLGKGGAQSILMGSVLLAATENVLRPPKAEDDVHGICPAGCLEQLLPGPERRLLWEPGRRRLHPRGCFCTGIRKAGKSLVFTCGPVVVSVCEHETPVGSDLPHSVYQSPSGKPGSMRHGIAHQWSCWGLNPAVLVSSSVSVLEKKRVFFFFFSVKNVLLCNVPRSSKMDNREK